MPRPPRRRPSRRVVRGGSVTAVAPPDRPVRSRPAALSPTETSPRPYRGSWLTKPSGRPIAGHKGDGGTLPPLKSHVNKKRAAPPEEAEAGGRRHLDNVAATARADRRTEGAINGSTGHEPRGQRDLFWSNERPQMARLGCANCESGEELPTSETGKEQFFRDSQGFFCCQSRPNEN